MKRISFLASVLIAFFCASSFAGELVEDFILAELIEDIWWIKTTGKAVAEVKNGELILSSFGAEDSIYLLYKEPIPPGEPITLELRVNLGTNTDDVWFGFLQDFPGDTHFNQTINVLKDATMFFVKPGGMAVQPRGEDGVKAADIPIKENEFHIFRIEVTDEEYSMEIDGKEVHRGTRNDAKYRNRVFYMTPDGFDNFFGPASYTVDWIRLSGPTIPNRVLAVTSSGKLPIVWGKIKQ